MSPVLFVLLLCLRTAQLRHHQGAAAAVSAASREPFSTERTSLHRPEGSAAPDPKRVPRGAADGTSRRTPDPPSGRGPPRRPDDPSGYFTTRRAPSPASARPGNGSSPAGLLRPALGGSRWAYVIAPLALALLAAGVVGNLALTCAVWHDLHLQSAWNHVLAGLALCDLLVLLTCLPVVVFHALTARWLLGDVSCRLVPYVEVTSLGVATFSLCALSIDRFHAAAGPAPPRAPRPEPCRSILSKLSVVWVGSMVLAAPELLLWQLRQQTVGPPPPLPGDSLAAALRAVTDASKADTCVREPSPDLPEGVFPLVLTYHEARAWWIFGCYLCLPLLFTAACDLVTGRVLAQRLPRKKHTGDEAPGRCSASYYSSSSSSSSSPSPSKKKQQQAREQRLRSAVMALAALYGACNLPESVGNIALAYAPAHAALALPALSLAGQFLLFARCSASPVLLLCLCRPLGQAFVDCCCCCCCVKDGARPSSSASTAAVASSPSPTSPSPTSLSPSGKDETTKSLLAAKDSAASAVGTPC